MCETSVANISNKRRQHCQNGETRCWHHLPAGTGHGQLAVANARLQNVVTCSPLTTNCNGSGLEVDRPNQTPSAKTRLFRAGKPASLAIVNRLSCLTKPFGERLKAESICRPQSHTIEQTPHICLRILRSSENLLPLVPCQKALRLSHPSPR